MNPRRNIIRTIAKLQNSTVLYLFSCYMNIQNVSSSWLYIAQPAVKPVVQPAAKCKRTLKLHIFDTKIFYVTDAVT